MSNMLVISLLSFVCMASHLRTQRNPGSPGVVHGIMWLFVSLGYVFFLGEVSAFSTQTLLIMMIGIAAFSIGIYFGLEYIWELHSSHHETPVAYYFPAQIVLVSAIGLAMMLNKAFQIMPIDQATSWFGSGWSWYTGLRNNLVLSQAKGSFGFASYVLNFSFAGTAYLILFSRRRYLTPWLWISIVLSLGFALLSTGRTHLVLFGCMVVGAAMPATRSNRVVLALFLPLLGAAILFLATFFGGRLTTTSSETIIASLVHTQLKGYILTPVGAFDIFVNSGLPNTWGSMTFRTPLAVLRFLGIPIEVPEMIQPNVTFASFLVNVYTVFSPYYRDFGMAGVGLFMGLLGTLHGWIFRQLKTGMPIIVVANALLFYALFMQFFQDQYFSLMSQWIQIIFWIYLFNKLQPLPLIADHDKP